MAQSTQRPASSLWKSAALTVTAARQKRWLALRRLAAWGIELSLLVGSAGVPWLLGDWVRRASPAEPVPLNPAVMTVQHTTARLLGQPKQRLVTAAPPLTNLLWFGAVVLPLAVVGTQFYSLATAGKPLGKRWLGLQVVALDGMPPGYWQAVKRECVGKWGLPLLAAYGVWLASGAFPNLMLLGGLTGASLLGQGLTAQTNRERRALHDWLGGTRVVALGEALLPVKYYPNGNGRGVQQTTAQPALMRRMVPNWYGTITVAEEEGGLTAVVLAPYEEEYPPPLQGWRQRPRLWLAGGLILTIGLGALVWLSSRLLDPSVTQDRSPAQEDALYLALVNTLSSNAPTPAEQQAAVLALASTQDPRAIPLLADLLAQTQDPKLLETLQQALITLGPRSLPYLRRLNQTFAADIAALPYDQSLSQRQRQRVVKRTIAKLLTLHNDHLAGLDLSRTDLGQVFEGPDTYRLVLAQQTLAGLTWQGAVLSGANFRKARFFDPGPDGRLNSYDDWVSDLSGSDLTEANFSQAQLQSVILRGASLLRANLDGSQASDSDFTGANLSSARLINAQLQNADLTGASLVGADLTEANLIGATLTEARLKQATGLSVDLSAAQLHQADLQDTNFTHGQFQGADLSQANLSNSQLKAADLSNADLRDANLQGADLRQVNLQGAALTGANFESAEFYETTTPQPGGFIAAQPEITAAGALAGVDFSQALNLSNDQLAYICAQGGLHPRCSAP